MPTKANIVAAQLRAKIGRRDRHQSQIDALDTEIKALVRSLSAQQGLVVPMRVEQARQIVFNEKVEE